MRCRQHLLWKRNKNVYKVRGPTEVRPVSAIIPSARRNTHAKRFLFFAFGHHHLGLTQAAVTGQLIADLVCRRPSAIDLRPFRIDRFTSYL